MAIPRFVDGETTKIDAANALTRTIPVPVHEPKDMIVLAVVSDQNSGTISAPGFGYIYQDRPIVTGTPTQVALATVMWKMAGASEGATYTIDTSVLERVGAICFAIRGAASAIHATATEVTGDGVTVTIPAVTTSVDECLRISIAGSDAGITTTGAVTNHTLITQVTGTSAGGVSAHYKTIPTATTDASETVALTATEQWIGFSFAVAPSAGGEGPLLGGISTVNGVSSGAGTTIPIDKPTNGTGVVDGDFMLWHVSSASTVGFTPDTGWTLIDTSTLTGEGAGGNKTAVYWKVANSEPASYTFTFGSSFTTASMGIITYWSITDTDIEVDVFANSLNTPATPNHVAPDVTTTKVYAILHSFYSVSGTAAGTPHTGMTERWDLTGASCAYLMTATIAATGAVGARTMTGASLTSAAITVAIAEVSGLLSQAVEGTVGIAGTLTKTVLKALGGTATPTGAVTKTTSKSLAGTLGVSGSLSGVVSHIVSQAVEGAIGIVGTLTKTVTRALGGTVTPTGDVSKTTGKSLGGTVGVSGSLGSRRAEVTPQTRQRSGIYSQDNLSFTVSFAPWVASNEQIDYTQDVKDFSCTSTALGGFWNADLTLRLPLIEIEQWMNSGVGKQLTVKGKGATVVWEGIVNRVTVNLRGYRTTIGPFMDIANLVRIAYTLYLDIGGGSVTGIRLLTDPLQSLSSQAKYGILAKTFSAEKLDADSVAPLSQLLLDRYSIPQRSEDLNISDRGDPYLDVTIECLGYVHLFQKYMYASAVTGVTSLSALLSAILAAEPNAIFSSEIIDNPLAVPSPSAEDTEAWGLIKSLVSLGDASFTRYLFGVYENRKVVYKPVENEVFYLRPLREGAGIIQDSQGGMIEPWAIRPGTYVKVTDFSPGRTTNADLNLDEHTLFAETVQFRMPNQLLINGSHSFKVEQRIAQLGLSGIG